MPDTRPDVPFTDGVCAACLTYEERPTVDWRARKHELELLLERGRNGSGYDCIVPSSGGKDSHYQVLQLIALGARPLVITASTCHLTNIGRMNIENLKRYATTIEVSPNKAVRAKLNRLGLEQVGDISWPEHVGIFSVPFTAAACAGIPLIFYGECPQNQYGGPPGTEEAKQLTRRWRSEFGGFLGFRPADAIGQAGITKLDMADYLMPEEGDIEGIGIEAHFLGQYLPWDSHENARQAQAAGMVQVLPSDANWWHHENLDNAQTGLHDHQMYRKFGFGRLCSQVSVDVRARRLKREQALEFVTWRDGTFPEIYMGVSIEEALKPLGLDRQQLQGLLDRFTNHALFDGEERGRPILKEGV